MHRLAVFRNAGPARPCAVANATDTHNLGVVGRLQANTLQLGVFRRQAVLEYTALQGIPPLGGGVGSCRFQKLCCTTQCMPTQAHTRRRPRARTAMTCDAEAALAPPEAAKPTSMSNWSYCSAATSPPPPLRCSASILASIAQAMAPRRRCADSAAATRAANNLVSAMGSGASETSELGRNAKRTNWLGRPNTDPKSTPHRPELDPNSPNRPALEP